MIAPEFECTIRIHGSSGVSLTNAGLATLRACGLTMLVLAFGGCDIVWSVPSVRAADAGIDAVALDAAPDALACFTFDTTAEADVILFQSTPTQGHPADPFINVGTAAQSQALIRFLAPSLTAGQRIAAVRFSGPWVASSHDCPGGGATCGSCMSLAHAGTFDVEYATSLWDEGTACYAMSSGTMAWAVTGATGATDRSVSVGQQTIAAAHDLDVELEPALAAQWIQNGKLSIIVTPSAQGVTLIPQREYAVKDATCNPNQRVTKLTFTVCQ